MSPVLDSVFVDEFYEKPIVDLWKSGYLSACADIIQLIKQEAAARFADPESEFEEVVAKWEDILKLVEEVRKKGENKH